MHNVEVPDSVALVMLGILVTVAAIYTATAIRSDSKKKEVIECNGHLIVGQMTVKLKEYNMIALFVIPLLLFSIWLYSSIWSEPSGLQFLLVIPIAISFLFIGCYQLFIKLKTKVKLYSFLVPLGGAFAVSCPVFIDGSHADGTIFTGITLLISLLIIDIGLIFYDFKKFDYNMQKDSGSK